MGRYIVAAVGGCIAAAALVYLIRLAVWQLTGVKTVGEVVAVSEPEKGRFVHTLRYTAGGKELSADDKTGYSQAFPVGERLEIVCRKGAPEQFEYAAALRKNMVISGILIAMSVLIVVRFMFFVDEL